MRKWWRRGEPDDMRLGHLTFWEKTNDEGEDLLIWAEMSTARRAQCPVAQVKQIMRDCGWTQTVGD